MEKIKKFRFSLNGIVLTAAFLGIVLIGTVVNENFLTMKNILSIFQQMSEMGIMALGLTIVIITGGNDLASGTTMGLCAVVSGLCLTSGMPIPLALLISLAAAVACGCLNASLVALIGIPPMIATLGTQMFFYGAALVLSKGNSISNIPREFYFLGQDKLAGLPLQAVILILLTIVLAVILKKKVFGKHLFAIGNNIKASAYSGIRTVKV